MDKGFHTEMILGDLNNKVFDTLYHTILLQRVQLLVLRSYSLNDFYHISQTENFCDTRKCFFRSWINELCCSTTIFLRALLFFLTYINDFLHASNEPGSYLYADDTCIFYQDEYVKETEKRFK